MFSPGGWQLDWILEIQWIPQGQAQLTVSQGNQGSGSVRGYAPLESDWWAYWVSQDGPLSHVSGSGAHGGAATKWSTCTWMILLLMLTMYTTGPRA